MAKRGKILRDANASPGLLMIEGQQYPFSLEGLWKSEVPPRPGLPVDVDFDSTGKIRGITAVPESQLAKEQAEADLKAAREHGGKLFGQIVAKVGMTDLVAGVLLLISWTFLTAASMQAPFGVERQQSARGDGAQWSSQRRHLRLLCIRGSRGSICLSVLERQTRISRRTCALGFHDHRRNHGAQ